MDAPGRHLRAKVVSTDHLRRRPWGRLTRSDWTLRSGFSRHTGQTRPAVWWSADTGWREPGQTLMVCAHPGVGLRADPPTLRL